MYKYHAAIRTHLKINGDIKQIRHIALKAISEVVLVMDDPADLINVAIETLVKENCELPAFSTLDILVRRLRNLAHQRIFQKDWFIRQHLETCVFSYVAAELKTGDLCVRGSEQFTDYWDQLLSWEECEPKVAEYCQQLGFAMDAEGFVEGLKRWLTQVSLEVDRTKPDNHELVITEKGEPVLKKPPLKTPPKGLAKLEAAVAERMPESHVLDILCRIDYWTKWTRHLGPLSGADPKMENARVRQILTAFAYASHLGRPRQRMGEKNGQ
jgi:Tn3 transposase DDE domain